MNIEQNSEWNIYGRKWTALYHDRPDHTVLCISMNGINIESNWISETIFIKPWRDAYHNVTELWIAEGAPVKCRFTGLARDCQSKTGFPGAKKYRITTEEIV